MLFRRIATTNLTLADEAAMDWILFFSEIKDAGSELRKDTLNSSAANKYYKQIIDHLSIILSVTANWSHDEIGTISKGVEALQSGAKHLSPDDVVEQFDQLKILEYYPQVIPIENSPIPSLEAVKDALIEKFVSPPNGSDLGPEQFRSKVPYAKQKESLNHLLCIAKKTDIPDDFTSRAFQMAIEWASKMVAEGDGSTSSDKAALKFVYEAVFNLDFVNRISSSNTDSLAALFNLCRPHFQPGEDQPGEELLNAFGQNLARHIGRIAERCDGDTTLESPVPEETLALMRQLFTYLSSDDDSPPLFTLVIRGYDFRTMQFKLDRDSLYQVLSNATSRQSGVTYGKILGPDLLDSILYLSTQ